jgi:hypothetical protein
MKYVRCKDVAKQIDMSMHHAVRSLRTYGLDPIKRPFPDTRGYSRLHFSISEDDAQRFIAYRKGESTKELVKEPTKESVFRLEEQQEQKRKNEGWTVIPTYKAGAPDLILIRRDESGRLEIELEEVKSSSDGVRKEQYLFAEKMKELGIKTNFTWI